MSNELARKVESRRYRRPNRDGAFLGETVRRDQVGCAGRGRVTWLACEACGAGRWTDAKKPAKRCQSCQGKHRSASVDLNAYGHQEGCECLRCCAQRGETQGADNPGWRGGLRKQSQGYVYILTLAGYRLEHRVVSEIVLGRPLRDDEEVHHINEVRNDNRPENLRVMTRSEHRSLHNRMRYGTEANI